MNNYYSFINENEDNYELNEICPRCGARAMYIYDFSPIAISDKYSEDNLNFDTEIEAYSKCDKCGFKLSVTGSIKWEVYDKDKRKKYKHLLDIGIEPEEVEKFNL